MQKIQTRIFFLPIIQIQLCFRKPTKYLVNSMKQITQNDGLDLCRQKNYLIDEIFCFTIGCDDNGDMV